MKLLNPEDCQLPSGGGNVKELTMIVEVHGIDFRTGVRFPSGPLKSAVFAALFIFCVVYSMNQYEGETKKT